MSDEINNSDIKCTCTCCYLYSEFCLKECESNQVVVWNDALGLDDKDEYKGTLE